jgi:3-oxoadipate enol-lactonase
MPFTRAGDLTVHYDITGPADAPPLVFVNSLGTNLHLWDAQATHFAQSRRVVRYDLRGHGMTTTTPQENYRIEVLADDLAALLDALGIARAAVVGLSIGGVIAQRFAAQFPERVERLVLCATGNRIGSAEMWSERIAHVRREGIGAIVPATLRRWFASQTHDNEPATVDGFRQMLSRTPVDGYASCCAALRDADLAADDARIVAPTLVIAGDADAVTPPATAAELCAAIPGAELAVIPGAAHIVNIDAPAAFNALLDTFLAAPAASGVAA